MFACLCGLNTTACQKDGSAAKSTNASTYDAKIIYGRDTRMNLYQNSNPIWAQVADATVALAESRFFYSTPEGVGLDYEVYKSAHHLCEGERFSDELIFGYCSGILVAPDLVLTAGHCLPKVRDCNETRFVFGHARKSAATQSPTLAASEIYRCRQLIHTEQNADGLDFAVARLDRAVVNHKPAVIATRLPRVGEPLATIGYPNGLPVKIMPGGTLRFLDRGFAEADIQSATGNSGAAVINAETGEILGVDTRGLDDFVKLKRSDGSSCNRSQYLPRSSPADELETFALAIDALPYLSVKH